MNEYSFEVNFKEGMIYSELNELVTNDYKSSLFRFEFDKEGKKLFKLKYPDDTYFVQEIVDNELLLDKGVLYIEGQYQFEISLYGDDNRLTTTNIYSFYVRQELVDTDEIVEPDDRVPVLDNLINEVESIKEDAEAGAFDGATFIPNVDDEGNISWTNDKEKENPETKNIKGVKGDTGNGIDRIEKTNTLGNIDVYTIYYTNGTQSTFNVTNGKDAVGLKKEVVDELPLVGEDDVLYLVPKEGSTQDIYDEWIYVNNEWEHIGSTDVDLSNYYDMDQVNELLDDKQDVLTAGDNITIENNVISASGSPMGPVYFLELSDGIKSGTIRDVNGASYSLSTKDKIKLENIIQDAYNNNYASISLILSVPSIGISGVVSTSMGVRTSNWNNITLEPSILQFYFLSSYDDIFIPSNPKQIMSIYFVVTLTWENHNVTVISISTRLSAIVTNILTTNNTNNFTPTTDYNPATKKYVDDSIASIPSGGISEEEAQELINTSIEPLQNLYDYLEEILATLTTPTTLTEIETRLDNVVEVKDNE